MPSPFTLSGQSASGAFGDLFAYALDKGIINILDSVDDFEKWIDSIKVKDWGGGDSQHKIYQIKEGTAGRYVSGGPGSLAPVIPAYNPPEYVKSYIILYAFMDIVSITGPKLIRAYENGPAMWRGIMKELIETAKRSHRNRVAPHYWGVDNTGTLCLVTTADTYTSAQNCPVKQREVGAAWGSKAYAANYAGARYLRPGMQLRIGTAAEHAAGTADYCIVTSINRANQTFRPDRSITVAADDIVTEGDANGTSYNSVPTGMMAALRNDNTYHGIDRTSDANEAWRAIYNEGTPADTLRPFDNFLITSILFEQEELGPKPLTEGRPVIMSHRTMLEQYLKGVEPVHMKTDLKAVFGHETIAFMFGTTKIPWQVTRAFPLNKLAIVDSDKDVICRVQLTETKWDTSTGSVWKMASNGTFALQAFTYNEEELVVDNPRMNVLIDDLDVPAAMITGKV